MSDSDDHLLDEIETATYNNLVKVIEVIHQFYESKADGCLIYARMASALTKIVGELIAAWPTESREDIEKWVSEQIAYHTLITEIENDGQDEETEEEESSQKYDLTKMKPLGNA